MSSLSFFDDFDLKMFETKAELAEIKEEIREIRNQNNALKNEITLRTFIDTVNKLQSKIDVLSTNFKEIQQTVTSLYNRDSNYDHRFSELNENLRRINEKLDKYDTILSQNNGISIKQNETTQVLNTNQNNLGNRSFILLIHSQEKQTILLVGGNDAKRISDTLLMLEKNEQNWKQLNIKLPYAIYGHGAQFLDNNLYIFGGCGQANYSVSTYKLSKSLKWEKMADMNQKRYNISNISVVLNNQIWVCGGWDNSVEMYDPETNKWNYMKQMNESRRYAAAVVNGKIFCSGGTKGWREVSNSVEYYDSSSDVWTFICDMPEGIKGHGAVEIDGHFIIMGGFNGNEMLKNVWILDTADRNAKWIEKPSMSIPREDFSIAKIHNKIFVCGGNTKENEEWKIFGDVELFDGKVWRDGPKMSTYRRYAPAVVIPMEFARSLS